MFAPLSLPYHFDRTKPLKLICLVVAATPFLFLIPIITSPAPETDWISTLAFVGLPTAINYVALFFIVRRAAPQKGMITRNLITLDPFRLPYLGWSSKGGMFAVADYGSIRVSPDQRDWWALTFVPTKTNPSVRLTFSSEEETRRHAEFFARELNLPIENAP